MRCRFLYCVSALVDLLRWMTYVEMEAITMLQFAAGVGLFCAFVVFYFYIRRNGHSKDSQNVSQAPDDFDEETEVVVVGAGVLGSAIAAALARDGRCVTAVERDLSEPNRIVGELLQPGGFRALKKLGLQGAVEGIDAHIVHGYVVHDNDSKSSVALSYPVNEHDKIQTGRSFHHGRFVMGLREEARKAKAYLVEGTVVSLLEDKEGDIVGVLYKEKETGNLKAIKADLTIVADGCFSKFRKGFTNASVSVSSHFAGIIMHNCPQYKEGHAEIVLPVGGSGPMLIYQISKTSTRILVDVGKIPSDTKQFMKETVAPQLPKHIVDPFLDALEKGHIRSMPNSFLPSAPVPKPGLLILGDALNMRHPLTGAGMSVALNDALIWRELLSDIPSLQDHARILQCSRQFQWQRKMSHSFVVNVLAQALYALFSASDEYLHYLRQACFQYFRLGGMAVSGPIGLLSVILSSCGCMLHLGIYKAVMVFVKACQVIFPLIASELLSLVS